jgi:sulfite oxidase
LLESYRYNFHALLIIYRIGDLLNADEDPSYVPAKQDPGLLLLFENDPERHHSLIKRSERPCNAESATESLNEYITPNELFYVRHHLPVPKMNADTFVLQVDGPDGISKSYTLEELKSKFPKADIMATIQCAGNRRQEMHQIKPVKGYFNFYL